MLSANVPETPRPRPPAKVRRTSLLKNDPSPPPSYYNSSAFAFTPQGRPRLDTLLGSPITATFQRVGWDADRDPLPPASEDLEWMNEKSREELSDLLVKADDIIKERENELGAASAVCKSLYENNVTLKTKHQALLARLPSTPSRSPSPSLEAPSMTPSRYSINLSRPVSEYEPSSIPTSYKGHARKISVSTAEISHLADQNAELLDKLEKLESESFSADQSGRRVLKRLEKEISILREELEKTQAKSEELEEKTKAGFGWDSEKVAEGVLRKKQERELKFKAMRNLGQGSTDDDEGDPEIRDFAPEGSLFGGPSATYSFFPPGESPRRPSGTPFNHATLPRPAPPAAFEPESSLIAKLLVKIQELEDANSRIIEQQMETTNQLNAMQRETEQISKVYECFADENIIEFAADQESNPEGGKHSPHDDTIRFRSFKRNLGADGSPSRWRESGNRSINHSSGSKIRKSVVGLFDGPAEASSAPPQETKAFALPIPLSSSSRDEGHHSTRSIGSMGLISPALSILSLSPLRSPIPSPLNTFRPTLESELGNEFSDGWGLSTGNHHLRTSSLYDLTQMSAPPSPSPSPSRMSYNRSRSASRDRGAMPTPMSMGNIALRLSVEPPTPDKVPETAATSIGKQSARYHRMSQTLRSRTSRWVNGRFKDTLTGGSGAIEPRSDDDIVEKAEPLTPLPLRLSNAFDDAVENVAGQPRKLDSRPRSSLDDEDLSLDVRVEKRRSETPGGLGSVMLELWLWLQFAIIIVVFLWAMAKRGPKSVLGQPTQRRVASESTRR